MDFEQVKLLQRELQSHKCLWCESEKLNVEQGVYFFANQLPNHPPQLLPFVIITCLNCGMEHLFNAKVKHLLPADAQIEISTPLPPNTTEDVLEKFEKDIRKETGPTYALEARAGILMGIVAAIIALVFNIPQNNDSVGYITLYLLVPLIALIPSFFYYMFTFLPSVSIKPLVVSQPGVDQQAGTAIFPGMDKMKLNLEKLHNRKTKRIRLAHSFFAAGVGGLVASQFFIRYASDFIIRQSRLDYIFESLILIALQALIFLIVRPLFKTEIF